MVILTTTYNCESFVERSIMSIMSQRYKDFKCYITDDMSTDNTVKVIKETIKDDPRFILIENHEKFYQPVNYEQVIRWRGIEGDEICVEVDGDDRSFDIPLMLSLSIVIPPTLSGIVDVVADTAQVGGITIDNDNINGISNDLS